MQPIAMSAVTMTSLELVDFINNQRGEGESKEWARLIGFDAIAVLVTTSGDLMRSDETNCAARYDAYEKADQMAMHCAHALRDHPFIYRSIQDARMLATLSCIHWTRDGVRYKDRSKTGEKTYIAMSTGSGLIKIGRSINPEKRMAQLQVGAAEKPRILLVIDGDIERALHDRFRALRVFGEWFRDDGSIAEYVESAKGAGGAV